METDPGKRQQIIQAHGELIRRVVLACQQPQLRARLEPVLRQSESNGWNQLVAAIRKILAGRRGADLLNGLDAEDGTIIDAILLGLQNPENLRDIAPPPEASMAAPVLAAMISSAAHGDASALAWLANMAEQMIRVEGDMTRLGAILRRMVDGERDADALCAGMQATGEQLVLSILEELGKLEQH